MSHKDPSIRTTFTLTPRAVTILERSSKERGISTMDIFKRVFQTWTLFAVKNERVREFDETILCHKPKEKPTKRKTLVIKESLKELLEHLSSLYQVKRDLLACIAIEVFLQEYNEEIMNSKDQSQIVLNEAERFENEIKRFYNLKIKPSIGKDLPSDLRSYLIEWIDGMFDLIEYEIHNQGVKSPAELDYIFEVAGNNQPLIINDHEEDSR